MPPLVLERDVPVSQSLIWRRQRDFYAQRGLKAWSLDSVPAYITNNPFIAEIYAGIVFGFVRDCIALRRSLSPQTPLRILELGAGPGKFSYLFLQRLAALLRAQDIAPVTVRYCMTDSVESVVQSWRSNHYFSDFVAGGMLEFELLRVGGEIKSPFLAGRGPGDRGPLVIIANYVFDSLPQDAFVVEQGQIFEALLTTETKHPPQRYPSASGTRLEDMIDTGKPGPVSQDGVAKAPSPVGSNEEVISSLHFSFKNAVLPKPRYSEPSWNEILELYRSGLPAATVLFPCQALKVLKEIAGFSDGAMLVLASDKGYAHQDALLLCQGPPALEFHTADCFSQMVNFDAIGKYFKKIGGEALLPDKHFSGLNLCGFLQHRPREEFPATRAAYRHTQEAFGPDDLFTLLAWLNAHMEEMTVPQILSALRLTRWDTTALVRLFPVLARQIRSVSAERPDLRNDLREAVLRTWANHFPVSHGDNILAFDCGVILLELRYFEEAASMFRASQTMFSPSAATSYNLGLCALGLDRRAEALQFMEEACNLDPQFEPARASRLKLQAGGKVDG
jgi:hypothetical protein